tara:strand:- start:2064 stop:2480 length:417 start_codon:yes stop_codon:yes gene_type:complete
MKRTINIIIGLYFFLLVFLAIRPKIPYLYDNFFPISSAGGWNMYQYKIDQEVNCFIKTEHESIPVNWKRYFYHSTFVNSAHPNFRKIMGEKFCDFLMENDSIVLDLKKKEKSFKLLLEINIIINEGDTLNYNYERRSE